MAVDEQDPDAGLVRMSLVEHLRELRRRLVICAIAVTVGAVGAFFLYNWVLHFLREPYCAALHGRHLSNAGLGCNLVITDPLEGFTTRLKVSGYLGLFFASPIVLWQLWRFITPGLHRRGKKYALPVLVSSLVLFAPCGLVAHLTFPQAPGFLIGGRRQG